MTAAAHIAAGATLMTLLIRLLGPIWGIILGVAAAIASHPILDGICGYHALRMSLDPRRRRDSVDSGRYSATAQGLLIAGNCVSLLVMVQLLLSTIMPHEAFWLGGFLCGWFGLADTFWVLRAIWPQIPWRFNIMHRLADWLRVKLFGTTQPERPWTVSYELLVLLSPAVLIWL